MSVAQLPEARQAARAGAMRWLQPPGHPEESCRYEGIRPYPGWEASSILAQVLIQGELVP